MTEKQKRAAYKLVFGKEFDSPDRRQTPLPLDIAYATALHGIKKRLEYLRGEIEAERISYDEISELQGFVDYIEPGDNLLLEWAGVPENQEFNRTHTRAEVLESRQAVIDSNS